MDEGRTERFDAAAGIGFVVLMLFATFVAGAPPSVTDDFGDIQEFWVEKRESIQGQAFFTGLATIPFLWFLGTLRGRLRRAEGAEGRFTAVTFGSGVVIVALLLTGTAVGVAPTLHAEALDVGDVRLMFDLQLYLFALIAFPAASLTGGVAAVALRTGALPRWLAIASAVTAAVSVLTAIALYGEDDSFFAIGGGAGFLAYVLFLAWVVAVSVALLRPAYPRPEDGHRRAAEAEAP